MIEGFIFIAVIAGLFFFLREKKDPIRPEREETPPSVIPFPKRSPSGKAPSESRPTYYAPATPSPFNEKTARDAVEKPVIRGRAYVVDGDTVVIRKTQIRLFGVDAPEMNHPYGKKAKWALVKLCKGQEVKAEVTDVDAHGRTVAKCFLPDGRDLSAEMVKLGLAIDWPKFSDGAYRSLEVPDVRKKLWLADARQKGRMHIWDKYDAKQKERQENA